MKFKKELTFQIFLVSLDFPTGGERILDPEVLETGVFTHPLNCVTLDRLLTPSEFQFLPLETGDRKTNLSIDTLLPVCMMALDVRYFP